LAGIELIQDLSQIRNILIVLNLFPLLPITVFGNHQNANNIVTRRVNYRIRYIKARYYYIMEKVKDGIIVVKYLPTKDIIADVFNKALSQDTIY